eukprot:comp24328_c4_seq1/m.45996 comp24328_c4_seq1/g.45996  ORF comp24328_c4_seq1/g.45996 comp24328_c4_seq1/m.45996 type:complete len:176 (-) comp24328_c4_seq1:425-952(-)
MHSPCWSSRLPSSPRPSFLAEGASASGVAVAATGVDTAVVAEVDVEDNSSSSPRGLPLILLVVVGRVEGGVEMVVREAEGGRGEGGAVVHTVGPPSMTGLRVPVMLCAKVLKSPLAPSLVHVTFVAGKGTLLHIAVVTRAIEFRGRGKLGSLREGGGQYRSPPGCREPSPSPTPG